MEVSLDHSSLTLTVFLNQSVNLESLSLSAFTFSVSPYALSDFDIQLVTSPGLQSSFLLELNPAISIKSSPVSLASAQTFSFSLSTANALSTSEPLLSIPASLSGSATLPFY